MTTANINVRVDAELKKEAEGLFNDLGLNVNVNQKVSHLLTNF